MGYSIVPPFSFTYHEDKFFFSSFQILEAEKWTGEDAGPHYLVHYQGWRARCE